MGGRFRRQLRGERERDGSLVMSLLGGGIGAWCGVCPCPELENEEKPGGRARGGFAHDKRPNTGLPGLVHDPSKIGRGSAGRELHPIPRRSHDQEVLGS